MCSSDLEVLDDSKMERMKLLTTRKAQKWKKQSLDPGCPLLLPSEGRGQRIPELLLGARYALDELDGLAVLDIHGGQTTAMLTRREPYREAGLRDREPSAGVKSVGGPS